MLFIGNLISELALTIHDFPFQYQTEDKVSFYFIKLLFFCIFLWP
ncbi:hypothetical protein LM13656_290001 [Listeria monocytogenes]|nr:hypothetical protein LM1000505_260001 [Listeria monocytogenes]CUK38979.1 hypothetical protein LM13656_290001 [Listeria monocytogenes]CUM12852.1 hypothetical protein LM900865_10207 [Listeria monocytogenes]CUM25603.1 hypothetical protein LM900701_350001 [Listeria monocytogenes]